MSNRAAVLAAIDAAQDWLTGHEVALMAGLQYKQTIDALTALHNEARIARQGRKFTAKWGSVELLEAQTPSPHLILDQVFYAICSKR